jgi:hypothetical protein
MTDSFADICVRWGRFTELSAKSLNYDEVKGYMSIKEAAEATKTDLKVFYEKFKIPENVPETTKMKEISQVAEGYNLDQAKKALDH